MCGIAGVVGACLSPDRVAAVLEAQRHRGPDDQGSHQDAEHGVTLCHNRLSIIDRSRAGRQPMTSPDGSVVLVFNGEIYNYRELRESLPPFPYRSDTDSEVLLAAYLEWGIDAVSRFNGMFAFAIWDGRTGRLHCARDRLGIKPFHHVTHGGATYFASEVKALGAAGVPLAPDPRVWADYLVHGYSDHGPETFFAGVRSLPPGHTLTLDAARPERVEVRRYWDLAVAAAQRSAGGGGGEHEFRDLLDDAVRLRLRADVPVGVNLSGGLDSASLLTAVQEALGGTDDVQTFTACFDDPAYDEADFANRVPGGSRWKRNTRRLAVEDVFELADTATWHQEAPFGGIATLAYHALHGLAAEKGVTVLLEGQGVDELLGGYRYFLPHHLRDLLEARRWSRLRNEARAAGDPRALLADLRGLLDGRPRNVYQDGTSHLRPHCLTPEVRTLAEAAPVFPRPFSDHLSNVLFRDLAHTKLPRVLRMNDRLSMAFSRELREPYLDHRIVELAFSLPADRKMDGGRTKVALRDAMATRLPAAIRESGKRAVVTPQREWLAGPLAGVVEDLVHSSGFRERGLFDGDAVAEELRRFTKEGGANAFFVWQWVNTELWFRRFG